MILTTKEVVAASLALSKPGLRLPHLHTAAAGVYVMLRPNRSVRVSEMILGYRCEKYDNLDSMLKAYKCQN